MIVALPASLPCTALHWMRFCCVAHQPTFLFMVPFQCQNISLGAFLDFVSFPFFLFLQQFDLFSLFLPFFPSSLLSPFPIPFAYILILILFFFRSSLSSPFCPLFSPHYPTL